MKVSSRSSLFLALSSSAAMANKTIDGPFMDPTLTEPCEYSCPDLSQSVLDIYCPRDFKDCGCDKGTERNGNACTCLNAFECPPNSTPRNGCPVSIRHCVCEPGYELQGNECVCVDRDCMTDLPKCDFRCPIKSRSSGLECPTSFDDCACAFGYAQENESCVCDSFCPENSVQKEGNSCPRNPCRHCECVEGYAMVGEECFPKCDYLCPPNTKPKDGLDCARSFRDCQCAPGLKKVDGKSCSCNLRCPEKSSPNQGVDCPINPNSDCTCKLGWVMENGVCVRKFAECFDCPENAFLISERYPNTSGCLGTFAGDCGCDVGFRPVGETCVAK